MEEMGRRGQIWGIFWKENPEDSLMGWVQIVREAGVKGDSKGLAWAIESMELTFTEMKTMEGDVGFLFLFLRGRDWQFNFRHVKFEMCLRTLNWNG